MKNYFLKVSVIIFCCTCIPLINVQAINYLLTLKEIELIALRRNPKKDSLKEKKQRIISFKESDLLEKYEMSIN